MASQVAKDRKTILAQNIRAARDLAGWTQRELAARIGVDTLAVSRWERAVAVPTDENLAALCEVLARDYAWFHTDHTEPIAA